MSYSSFNLRSEESQRRKSTALSKELSELSDSDIRHMPTDKLFALQARILKDEEEFGPLRLTPSDVQDLLHRNLARFNDRELRTLWDFCDQELLRTSPIPKANLKLLKGDVEHQLYGSGSRKHNDSIRSGSGHCDSTHRGSQSRSGTHRSSTHESSRRGHGSGHRPDERTQLVIRGPSTRHNDSDRTPQASTTRGTADSTQFLVRAPTSRPPSSGMTRSSTHRSRQHGEYTERTARTSVLARRSSSRTNGDRTHGTRGDRGSERHGSDRHRAQGDGDSELASRMERIRLREGHR